MIELALHVLGVQTLVLSAATVSMLAIRRPLVERFGAAAAYLGWALVPAALVAAALPHPQRGVAALPDVVARLVPALQSAAPAVAPARGGTGGVLLLAGWALVAAALAVLIAWRQRRFQAQVSTSGRLPAGAGPAVLGILRPRVVLPADFEQRFDATERGLMLAHEAVHQRRRDNAWNLLACVVVVAHWFNPLAWLAWRWMRFDQELSCDAAALSRGADDRCVGVYANALLKVQGVALRPPLATSWQSTHPLVERVRMLKLHASSSGRLRAGRGLAALAVVFAGALSYASQPPAPAAPPAVGRYTTLVDDGRLSTQVSLEVDGQPPHFVTRPDWPDQSYIRLKAQDVVGLDDWLGVRVLAKSVDGGHVQITTVLRDETARQDLGKPVVLTRMNEPARIEVSTPDGKHVVALTYVARGTGYQFPMPSQPLPAPPAKPAPGKTPPLPAPPAPVVRPDMPSAGDLPAPPALPAPPPVPGAVMIEDHPAPPAPPQRAP